MEGSKENIHVDIEAEGVKKTVLLTRLYSWS